MDDSIDRIRRVMPQRAAERVAGIAAAGPRKRESEGEGFSYEDRVDIAPAQHLQNAPDVIDLSLEMIRALIAGELPVEAIEALEAFAPIGTLDDARDNCLRVEQKGQDFIPWHSSRSLTQALELAAS